tara:strand:- start:1607 stop:2659 length:1053 start_codon:yes stop_codon:yes gene_type:complete
MLGAVLAKIYSKPTIKEVAKRAGVALSSVSRVLNNHDDVSISMRDRVLSAAAELGYEPNLLASGLRSGSTYTVGFLISDISNPLFGDIAWGAERTLDLAGYSMILANSEGDPERDVRMIRLLKQRRVDGLILSIADERTASTSNELKNDSIPIVLVDRQLEDVPRASAILTNHSAGVQSATEHLLALGHQRIALITGPESLRPSRDRVSGINSAFEATGAQHDRFLRRHVDFSAAAGESTLLELLGSPDPPTAVICGSNVILVGVLRALKKRSLRVGKDIALIACDDIPLTELHDPPITVVARDTTKIGESAASLLVSLMNEPSDRLRTVVLPTSLIVRDSTCPPSTSGR